MSKNGHPDESRLTAYADGELTRWESQAVEDHLAVCAECSALVREHREFLSDYRQVRRAALPPPPEPWANIRLRMEPKRPARMPGFRWLAAAAAVLIAVVVFQTVGSRTATAAELLQKAIVAEKRAAAPSKIRVKTRRALFVRGAKSAAAEEKRLASLFAEARFPWDQPLSPVSFAEWRDGLTEKSDRVRELPGKGYEITTTTEENILQEASITLKGEDMQAVQCTFRFRGDEYIEIAEAPADPVAVQSETKPILPGTPAPTVPSVSPITPSDELRVVAAIHGIRADLGDPVEITRDDERGRIVVSALGADPERQQQLRAALGLLRNVELQFEQPDAVHRTPAPAQAPRSAEPAKPSPLQDRLAAQLGGRTTAENFTNHVLDLSEASLARAHALRALARRFPPEVEAQLPAADIATLHRIEDDHTRALVASVRQMNEVIRPVLRSAPAASVADEYDTWQAGAENVLGIARELDGVLTRALTGTSPAANPDEALTKLGRTAADLQARVAALRTTVARALR